MASKPATIGGTMAASELPQMATSTEPKRTWSKAWHRAVRPVEQAVVTPIVGPCSP